MFTYRLGETKRISELITADEGATFAVSAAHITIYDESGAEAVDATASTSPGTTAAEQEVYYNHTPAAAGIFTFLLSYTVGAQTVTIRGGFKVAPAFSKYDRYTDRVYGHLRQAAQNGFANALDEDDVWNGLNVAVDAYSNSQPENARRFWQDVALSSVREYSLPDGAAETPAAPWVAQFSRLLRALYKPDATSRTDLKTYEYEIDDELGLFRLLALSPSTGQTLSLLSTAPHQLSHTEDTLPGQDFEWVTMYAAGVLLAGELANQASQTDAPEQGAGLVSYRDQQQRRRQQGMDLMARAAAGWKKAETPSYFKHSTPTFAFGRVCGGRGR